MVPIDIEESADAVSHLQVICTVIVRFLIECGIDVDIQSGRGETALYLASSSGELDVARFLIEQGADIHTRDNRGWNPLHVESRNGHLDVVRLLLDKGAAVDIRSENQQTPLAEASSEGQSCMHGISRAGPQHTSHRYTDMLR